MADIKVSVDEMDQAISEQLQKYAGSITEDMKMSPNGQGNKPVG